MSQKEVLPTTVRVRLGNVVKNILVLLISLILVLGVCEIILRVYNPLGFRIKGEKIILPVNKKEIICYEGSGKLDRVVAHQSNSLGSGIKRLWRKLMPNQQTGSQSIILLCTLNIYMLM
jgi:hypothetical protein